MDPANSKVHANGHNPDDPKSLSVIDAQVTEDNGEGDATEVTARTSDTRDDTVGE